MKISFCGESITSYLHIHTFFSNNPLFLWKEIRSQEFTAIQTDKEFFEIYKNKKLVSLVNTVSTLYAAFLNTSTDSAQYIGLDKRGASSECLQHMFLSRNKNIDTFWLKKAPYQELWQYFFFSSEKDFWIFRVGLNNKWDPEQTLN